MSLLDIVRSARNVFKGQREFEKSGQTPEYAYHSLVRLHCLTRGKATDWLHARVRRGQSAIELSDANGVLGNLDESRISEMVNAIRCNGYYIFSSLLPASTCDEIEAFALRQEAALKPRRDGLPDAAVFDPVRPLAEVYNFREPDLMTCPAIQNLAADRSFLAIAQRYLEVEPILDLVAMWWSARYSREASNDAAQLYHFDMDRIKWLKFFVYLSDVTSETGPHCYVSGSHRPNGAPAELLKRGYVRIPDADMQRCFQPEQFVEITGQRGTIIAVDTRGFHKGKPPVAGDRLIFQLEYCDSLFGGAYTKTRLPAQLTPELNVARTAHPRVYSKFLAGIT